MLFWLWERNQKSTVNQKKLIRDLLNKSPCYGEPAWLRDAGCSKIKDLSQLIRLEKFLVLFNQRCLSIFYLFII